MLCFSTETEIVCILLYIVDLSYKNGCIHSRNLYFRVQCLRSHLSECAFVLFGVVPRYSHITFLCQLLRYMSKFSSLPSKFSHLITIGLNCQFYLIEFLDFVFGMARLVVRSTMLANLK